MVFGLSKSKRKEFDPKAATGPAGKRAYAIGDVHGRDDLLAGLLHEIRSHNASQRSAETHIVFLGDLIDRGPNSRQVIDRLIDGAAPEETWWFVKGNHEEALVRGLRGESNLLPDWLKHGGYDTAESYGLEKGALMGQPDDAIEHLLLSAIPKRHIEFLSEFNETVRFGDYLFVHAGIKPGVAPEQQTGKDLRWIRNEFLNSEANFGCIVVHGHTISETVQIKSNRVGLDTGAYKTGILSALWIEGTDKGTLQVAGAPDSTFTDE
ncbi:MAG: metallophosphoesterase [Pseudomonadota bacterium]